MTSKPETAGRDTRTALLGLGLLLFCAPAALATEPAARKPSESAAINAPEKAAPPTADTESAQTDGKTSNAPDFERYIAPAIDTDLDLGLCDGS